MHARHITHSPWVLAWIVTTIGLIDASTAKAYTPEDTPSTPATISGSRDLLRSRKITQQDFENLVSEKRWQDRERDFLIQVMYWMDRDFRPTLIHRWTRSDLDLDSLSSDPVSYQGEIFHVKCRVVSIERFNTTPITAERFEITGYYRCQVRLGPENQPGVIFTQTVPSSWKPGATLDDRASADGLFLKLGGDRLTNPTPIFVARRVAWHPETLLGDLGMDTGRFDDLLVESTADGTTSAESGISGKRLTLKNRECFYQLLAATGRSKPGALLHHANQKLKTSDQTRFSVVPLFNEPRSQHGNLVVLSGTARQILPVRVSDEDVIERFGIRQYYQVFLFTEDSQENPLVFCVHELPEGIPTGEGPRYSEQLTVSGFFFNTWAYRNRRSETSEESPWQLAPLLIGREVVWYPSTEPGSNPWYGAIVAILLVFVLAGIWWALWWSSRGDKEFHDKTRTRILALDENVSLDNIGLETEDAPDFRGLEQDDSHEDLAEGGA